MQDFNFNHGGNIYFHAKKLNLSVSEIIDSSASLVPFSAPKFLINELFDEIKTEGFKYYPDKNFTELREVIGNFHNINPELILPGNGASELITWTGYEASKYKTNCLPIPGFIDYERSLKCWGGNHIFIKLPKDNFTDKSQSFPIKPKGDVLWITNPHNPTGQLWDRKSLEKLIPYYKLVICDEAFLSITPNGEKESLIPLIRHYDNLIIIRSLTKLFGLAGLRLGYILGPVKKLKTFEKIRDPWPLNSFAIRAGISLLKDKEQYKRWTNKIHKWVKDEKTWFYDELLKINKFKVHKSSTNFFLIESNNSLSNTINCLASSRIIIRECASFRSLNNKWARISLQSHEDNIKIVNGIYKSFL